MLYKWKKETDIMTRNEIYERINKVFREVFDNDNLIVNDSTKADDVNGWDSLMHITLISEIEDEFDVCFEMKDITRMQNLGELVDKIMQLL